MSDASDTLRQVQTVAAKFPPEDQLDSKLEDDVATGLPQVLPPSALSQVSLAHADASTTDGFAEGIVYTERYADGSIYVGTFGKNGRDGDGSLTYSNGDLYQGQFSADARHNQGRLTYASGDSYKGGFYRDELQGHGVFQYRDGWCYEGEFHGSMIHGLGLLAFARTDFPLELLGTEEMCGPSCPVVTASKIPGSIQQLLELTKEWGRYQGQFENGVRHGIGRMEFEAPKPSSPGSMKHRKATVSVGVKPLPSSRLEPHYLECEWKDGKRNGKGTVHIEAHVRYEGDFHEDEADGNGKLIRWFQGGESDIFEGEFRRGAVHGTANYWGPDGTVYCGQFSNGLRQGNGELHVRGTSYSGEFHQGARHGTGRYRSPKVTYSGMYIEDQRHGAGLLREVEADGQERVYEGEFAASMRQGEGRLKDSQCNYTGSWHHNVRHGKGRQTWFTSGDCYDGQWQDDKMHGHGTLVTTMIKYVGQFSKGQQNGRGLQVWWKQGGDTYEGQFHASRPHGKGAYNFISRGESYVGHMEHGVVAGEGSYTYADGSVYEGQWVDGKQHGQGQLTYQDGNIYFGQFHEDAFHGRGAFIEPNGCVHMCMFERNLRFGEANVMHADGQRELRRYDADGQEVERRLQPRVLPGVKIPPGVKMPGGGQWKGSAICSPMSLPTVSPRAPCSPLALSPSSGRNGLTSTADKRAHLPALA